MHFVGQIKMKSYRMNANRREYVEVEVFYLRKSDQFPFVLLAFDFASTDEKCR